MMWSAWSELHSTGTISAGAAAAASIHPLLAVGAREVGRAAAGVPAGVFLYASASIKARPVSAPHGTDLAALPVETLRARAGVIVLQVLEERRKGEKQGEEATSKTARDSECSIG